MLKFIRYLLMKIICRRIDHVYFTINAGFYELIGEDKKYYYLKSKKSPSAEHLAKVADYFHVSVDYLLGREEQSAPQFSPELLDAIDNAEGFSGKPLDDHDKEIIKGLLAAYIAGKNK